MAQLDDIVGAVMKKLKDDGLDDDTIVVFTTDNGAENFTWPDGGQTPFAGGKGTALEGGFRVPCIIRWPGKVPAGKVENGIISGLDWFPTFCRRGRQPEHRRRAARRARSSATPTYKVHLDGYNQTGPDHRQGPVEAPRDLLLHRGHARRGADRRLQVPLHRSAQRLARRHREGRLADPDQPAARSVRADGHVQRQDNGSLAYYNWFVYEFWRFVFVQQEVAKLRPDLHRVPADAEGRQLQHGGRQGANPQGHSRTKGKVAASSSQKCVGWHAFPARAL